MTSKEIVKKRSATSAPRGCRYVNVEEKLRKSEEEGKYVFGAFFIVLFERMHMPHGFENTLVDLCADGPAMEAPRCKLCTTK